MNLGKYLALGQKLEITVWTPLLEGSAEETPLSFHSYIKDMDPDHSRMLIDPPPLAREDLQPLLVSGNVVEVSAFTHHGKLIMRPKILDVQYQGLKGYWLEMREDLDYEVIQRRNFVRVPYMEPVDVEAPNKKFTCKGQDISAGGMRIACPYAFEPETLLRVTMTVKDRPLSLQAQVLRSLKNESRFASTADRYISTLQFVNLNQEAEKQLISECFRRELDWQSRQKGLE